MKKLLSISVIAALAALPMAANATVGEIVSVSDPTSNASLQTPQANNDITAQSAPKYALATEGANDDNLATAGYVKGAYNATMKAINKVSDELSDSENISYDNTDSGLTATDVQAAIDEIAGTAGSAVQSVVEGSTNGTVSVDGTDIAVHGLGTAAYTAASDYATAAQGAKADTALQAADLANYATHDGVENTIETATYTVSVPTLTAWGNDSSVGTAANVTVTAAATYAEPTPEPEEP
ncbi:MAG: hypothetical protein IJQ55_01315 [Alphaproteobacteria bacterium]|nr:hypothetical protein [Alphaproteobacteria bacterium]